MKDFKIHCSQIHKIMGRIGLTDKQLQTMNDLQTRHDLGEKPLTANMKADLQSLCESHKKPTLPDTCTTHLKEWYAGDHEEVDSKYTWKGNEVEADNIDFAARMLGYGMAEKNRIQASDEWFIGECDIDVPDAIIDVKSAWNHTTFLNNIYGIEPAHEYQGRGYMRLYNKDKFIVFHGLLDTPETEYRPAITFDHIPESQRWIAYQIKRDKSIEDAIIERVKLCRLWLTEYHKTVQEAVGKCR